MKDDVGVGDCHTAIRTIGIEVNVTGVGAMGDRTTAGRDNTGRAGTAGAETRLGKVIIGHGNLPAVGTTADTDGMAVVTYGISDDTGNGRAGIVFHRNLRHSGAAAEGTAGDQGNLAAVFTVFDGCTGKAGDTGNHKAPGILAGTVGTDLGLVLTVLDRAVCLAYDTGNRHACGRLGGDARIGNRRLVDHVLDRAGALSDRGEVEFRRRIGCGETAGERDVPDTTLDLGNDRSVEAGYGNGLAVSVKTARGLDRLWQSLAR